MTALVGGPASPSSPSAPPARRSTALVVVGVLVAVVAVALGVVMWVLAARRLDDNVAAYARAPVGCDTTLEVDRPGEFVLYIETTGEIEGLAGDCDRADRYDRAAVGLPRPVMALRNAAGDEIELGPTAGVDYDTGSFVGTAYRLVEVDRAGEYVLTVDDDVTEPYAIAVGGDPAAGVSALRWGALAVVVAGSMIAATLALVGGRRVDPPMRGDDVWRPAGPVAPHHASWPQSPPRYTTTPTGMPASPPGSMPPRSPSPPTIPGEPLAPWGPPHR